MYESNVNGFGAPVTGVGPVGVGQHVDSPLFFNVRIWLWTQALCPCSVATHAHTLYSGSCSVEPAVFLATSRQVHKPAYGSQCHKLPLTCTPAPAIVRLDQPTLPHLALGLNELAGDLQTKVAQAGEGSQIKSPESNVGHVEVFQMEGVTTPIIKRPQSPFCHNASPPQVTPALQPQMGKAPNFPPSQHSLGAEPQRHYQTESFRAKTRSATKIASCLLTVLSRTPLTTIQSESESTLRSELRS